MSSEKGVYVSIYAEITILKDENIRLSDILIRQRPSNKLLIWKTLNSKEETALKANCIQRDELYNLILANEW